MIKKGLKVKVLTGKDKKKEGEIIEIDRTNNRAKVKEINMVKKHIKTTKEKKGGIVTKESFIPLVLNIKHYKEHVEDNGDVFMRYGGSFDNTLPSFAAWETFMKFVYTYSEFSCTNKGESKVFFL